MQVRDCGRALLADRDLRWQRHHQVGRIAMSNRREVVVTGLGIFCPIGCGPEAVWRSLCAGRSGVGPLTLFDASALPTRIGGEVRDFEPRDHIRPLKSLKLMARDAQFGVSAAKQACTSAGIAPGTLDPDRFGVVLGADNVYPDLEDSAGSYRHCLVDGRFHMSRWGEGMSECFPLVFLRALPNMIASHISIIEDARGPSNTLHQGDLSGLLAVIEAARVIERGWADVMVAGGASARFHPADFVHCCRSFSLSTRNDEPQRACRPFDAARDGQVRGEGSAVLLLESRAHAEARQAPILARLLGAASAFGPTNGRAGYRAGLARAARCALADAGVAAGELGHVSAAGLSTIDDDRAEAAVLTELLPDVPVTAPKSYVGNLCAASGAAEAAIAILALGHGEVPPTLNYERPDPACPVRIVRDAPLAGRPATALVLGQTEAGQGAAMVLGGA
jgi:3-oxoacyl-[acyl-carrier-protein] synthase II